MVELGLQDGEKARSAMATRDQRIRDVQHDLARGRVVCGSCRNTHFTMNISV